jgi:hypothetical protein
MRQILIVMIFCCFPFYTFADKSGGDKKILFVIHSRDGDIKVNKENTHKGVLTLYNVDKTVTYFSDRPFRKAGKELLSNFLEIWKWEKASLSKDPPTAGLVAYKEDGKENFLDIPVVFVNPQYTGILKRLSFDIEVIDQSVSLKDGHIGETVLFIDDLLGEMADTLIKKVNFK